MTRTGQFTKPILSIFCKTKKNLSRRKRSAHGHKYYRFLPCRCQTNMCVWQDIVLVIQKEWDYAKLQPSSSALVRQDQSSDHFQQIGRIRLCPHQLLHIFPWDNYMLLQCLHMYYTQWAVQWKNKCHIKWPSMVRGHSSIFSSFKKKKNCERVIMKQVWSRPFLWIFHNQHSHTCNHINQLKLIQELTSNRIIYKQYIYIVLEEDRYASSTWNKVSNNTKRFSSLL